MSSKFFFPDKTVAAYSVVGTGCLEAEKWTLLILADWGTHEATLRLTQRTGNNFLQATTSQVSLWSGSESGEVTYSLMVEMGDRGRVQFALTPSTYDAITLLLNK